ncbi:MAG TPA: antibiotic biosynthesis monooxygenase [Vicinamibacterales bacterium]|jgi:quinol monooxygenase YgiN|nr:antibiotic biosynthesis monooxygenase [Vicinamibacterales bacterium]
MHILQVFVHVKPEAIEDFIAAMKDNASHSVEEPGVVRFDALQQADDPTRFTIIEVYRNPAGHAAHRETPHYARWRDTVADMMAEARTAVVYRNVSPDDAGW